MIAARLCSRSPITMRVLVLAALALAAACGVSPASAEAASPWWHLTASVQPTTLAPEGEGTLLLRAVNVGDAATAGPVMLSETMPAGVTIENVSLFMFSVARGSVDLGGAFCETEPTEFKCKVAKAQEPYEDIEVRVAVKLDGSAISGSQAKFNVSGGDAPPASANTTFTLSGVPTPFGIEGFSFVPEEAGGLVDGHAGSHPFQLTATLSLNQTADPAKPPALARNFQFALPPGLLGNATALAQCSDLDFRHVLNGGSVNLCPSNTAIGVAAITIDEPHIGLRTYPVPLFNLTPAFGEPARFGFELIGVPVTLDTSVRAGRDYGVDVHVNNISELANFLSSTVTIWGVPGDPAHDPSRGWGCLVDGRWNEVSEVPCTPSGESQPPPFLTMPTSCASSLGVDVEGASWPTKADPEGAQLPSTNYPLRTDLGGPLTLTGCNQLAFAPTLEVTPEVQSGSSPSGLTTHVRVPQEVNENFSGSASSSVKEIDVSLPDGLTVNPAAAGGLEACSEGQIGFLRGESNIATAELNFTPDAAAPFCSAASKIGTAKIKLPIIANPLEGGVYLAAQNANPFGSLIAMYVVAEDPVSGVLVKLAGEVHLSESGGISATFKNVPDAPFEDAELRFFGGSRAPLTTPASCGSYVASATFVPWSGTAAVGAQSSFNITSGPNGGPCRDLSVFKPELSAGTTSSTAGAFSPLVTSVSRGDESQHIQTLQLHMPGGLAGILSGVRLCSNAQASAGSCGAESEIGHTTVQVGVGGNPYTVTGGQVFLTEGYKGAPFGLSIVSPTKAGPFDLGDVVVRAKVEVDPHTAAITVTTDPIPHILDGIPLEIRQVVATIDRPGFTFNPTNCNPMTLAANVGGLEGASALVSVPFRATNCATLKFAPKFSVSTSAQTSKARGAGLKVKLAYPSAPLGTYANITKVKVALPKQLPSRLTTLQKACVAAVFEANPASCPPDSVVGHAKVITPVVPVPLTGPAYFVSHGGEAFPDLTIVLQGYGITVDLVGTTSIKSGVTTNTFKATPDVPFSSFELELPRGPFSALTANTSLCASKLVMPTEFGAQNGAILTQSTNIAVTGCKKPLTTAQKRAKAIKACGHKSRRSARARCDRQARARFPVKKSKRSGAKGK
jgi:hypothetical protein